MKHFLLDYNRATQKLVSITTFEDMDEALAAYSEREGAALGTEHEVVLLGAESEDELLETHGRYFYSIGEMWERAFRRSRERLAAPR